MASTDAVLLIAFGGPTRPEEIRPFLENVTRGRRIPPERLDEVVRHYERMGGRSPLNELTFRQADALRGLLGRTPVYVGMRNWEPHIADTLAQMALDGVRRATGVILSPHVAEIQASARAIAERLGRPKWEVAYQSRSGSPREPWLEPDVNPALERLAASGARAVVVAPVGFVCDHVEVLYDLDVEARATADRRGLAFARAATVNDHPLFVRMLADVVR